MPKSKPLKHSVVVSYFIYDHMHKVDRIYGRCNNVPFEAVKLDGDYESPWPIVGKFSAGEKIAIQRTIKIAAMATNMRHVDCWGC